MVPSAVAFDLDSTLAVTERPRDRLLDEATDAADAPALAREDYLDAHSRHLVSETREPIFDDLLSGDDDVTAEDVADAYREAILDALEPVPGAAGMLADLRERYRVGLLTNGPVVAQRGKIAELGWEDSFDVAVVTGELDAGKPDERAFAAVLDALDVDPSEAVYVGDHPDHDVRGAKAAGMYVVQVVFDGGPDPHPAADAHVEREDLPERLPELL
ncbi:HAD family hydrolase [Halomicrococcus sp. SG-WS-1]|uniref:HAD family hydrolase n=1 Tax=Halomicrococcus sp. SG-WS-1 TaxID=3439057 RepID=UPI003F78EAF6